MNCQNCDASLPMDPRDAIEMGDLEEVVAHIQAGEESFVASQTDYYCDAECFAEAIGEEVADAE